MTTLEEYYFPLFEDGRSLLIKFENDVFYLICEDEDKGVEFYHIPFPSLSTAKRFAKSLLLEAIEEAFS